ncbi:MAG: tripartite tricarboxylate transporter substrate binding protein, partial [Pseudomonadota bacterium]
DALAYYNGLFQKVFETEKWQGYRTKKALLGDKLEGDDLKAYWTEQRDRHEQILKASGAIN